MFIDRRLFGNVRRIPVALKFRGPIALKLKAQVYTTSVFRSRRICNSSSLFCASNLHIPAQENDVSLCCTSIAFADFCQSSDCVRELVCRRVVQLGRFFAMLYALGLAVIKLRRGDKYISRYKSSNLFSDVTLTI